MPLSVAALILVALNVLDIEILHVAVERGKSPGDMFAVPGDDERHSWKRDAGCMKSRRAKVCHVPDVWLVEAEVHVVGEERLSARRVRAGDYPVVGAGGAVAAGAITRRITDLIVDETEIGWRCFACDSSFIIVVDGGSWLGVRLFEVKELAGGRMIAPRPYRIKIRFEFR